MRIYTRSWSLAGALLSYTCAPSTLVAASPSINVGLKASFSAAPYLLELLETAANENATSYFPILDRIADGYFAKASTDKELYEHFLQLLKDDGHLLDMETLSMYKFALSMRSAAPRIEAHYQYYHTAVEPSLSEEQSISCPAWVFSEGKQYCTPNLEEPHGDIIGVTSIQELPFDRVLGDHTAPAVVLYADITSPTFSQFHKYLSKSARERKLSYRIRHRRALNSASRSLFIPGYGVELALKRTDYIVIDDREGDEETPIAKTSEKEVKFEDQELADLKPLSTSELLSLGLKASTFIMQSEDPFQSLLKLSQDFPKYSGAVSSHNVSADFLAEHTFNRQQLVPSGINVWWTNGVQMSERQVEADTLLDLLQKERKLINSVRNLGLTGHEAVQLVCHSEIANANSDIEPQRFDWRDDLEGGNVIIWLNDIERDSRYSDLPSSLNAIMQRVYPGQLPGVRKELFNLVLPIDFGSLEDIALVAETLTGFVKRRLTIRIGLVPTTASPEATEQAKVVYYLLDNYGLSAAVAYLELCLGKKAISPSVATLETVLTGKVLRADKVDLTLPDVLSSERYADQVEASKKWIARLSAGGEFPPLFVDGVAIPRVEDWLRGMSDRIALDLQAIQQGIFQDLFSQDSYIPELFLHASAAKRNALVVPEDEKTIRIFDVNSLFNQHGSKLAVLPGVGPSSDSQKDDWIHMVVIADLDTITGRDLIVTATKSQALNPAVELLLIHNPTKDGSVGYGSHLFAQAKDGSHIRFDNAEDMLTLLAEDGLGQDEEIQKLAHQRWQAAAPFVEAVSLLPGQNGIVLNGRLVGPITNETLFDKDDFAQLLSYESNKRIVPALTAMEALGLSNKIVDPLFLAKISSIAAISASGNSPPGIFDQAPSQRTDVFKGWKSAHTAIEVGDVSTASIHLTVSLDPASEHGQRWAPILKVLSELEGVHLRIFLNPKERLKEIPIKRFFKYVLSSQPAFDTSGQLEAPGASFTGVPQEALLTVALDMPPAWLVASKVSLHDLDNIKLGSIKTDVEALYELEHILIEGHSREAANGNPPSGAQLVLGTERDPHFADTIIMANLGYFQFKANPGVYNIDLQKGRSSEIYNIDSVGPRGWSPSPGDESTQVVLMSFGGATVYPRLSRKPGMETADVLEAKEDSPKDYVSRGLNFAQGLLGKAKSVAVAESTVKHADINIFSVASGHLYERMMNIMMVSVMKNTKHTVKFWFIEQFLSPSFKDFIPYLAAEYGFEYELVTYKWPHWLRAQTEKQREIWGYKILFLDVLFPLSLDKVIFVDADQIVRTDMMDLVNHDLQGAPYGFTPMCDSRTEMEGFRFWKQGYWEKFLKGKPYHISALYVVDLHRFRQIAAGDRLRQQYHQLSADPQSLSNLDQDLPNHMQSVLPIHSLPQEWLWCETWCSDESLKAARTIDLCNNPLTKEPKLDRARRQVPEWTQIDEEIAAVDRKRRGSGAKGKEEKRGDEANPKSRKLEEEVTRKDEL